MKIIRSMIKISTITMVSRIFGYIRDVIIAAMIGTGIANDAFIAAFKLTNLFRTIFGEGAMSSAFTPIFTQLCKNRGEKYAKTVATHIQSLLILALLCFIGLIFFNMPLLIQVTTPGFAKSSDVALLAIDLGYITFPYLFFISMAAFYGSILNAKEHFIPYAATSILLNIVIILTMFIFALYIKDKSYIEFFKTTNISIISIKVLAYSTLIAGVIELIWMMVFAYKNDFLLPLRKIRYDKYTKLFLKRLLPSLLGSGVAQVNIWIDMIIVSFIPGGMSYLYFADRVMQLPMALIGTAFGTVMLTAVAKSYNTNIEKNHFFRRAMIFTVFLIIPSTFGIYALAQEIIDILFARGKFDQSSVEHTAAALALWVFALPAFSMMKILTSTLYGHGNTKTPMQVAILAVFANALIGIGLLSYYSYLSVVIASIFSSWMSVILLFAVLHKKHYITLNVRVLFSFIKSILASFVMFLFLIEGKNTIFGYIDNDSNKYLALLSLIILGGIIYFSISFLLGIFRDIKDKNI